MIDTRFTHITVHPPDCRCIEGRVPEPREESDDDDQSDAMSPLEEQ